ncbi:hypothetical protein [Aquimarina sp. SS2-1]|uniref:hypothetical protein n=1 Tax=Aquimarina besae TaxID=3342247 RepID=UPI00366B9F9E
MRIPLLKKIFLPVFILINCISYQIIGQKDTIWYNQSGKVVNKENAFVYRPPVSKKGNLYSLKYYYNNDTPYIHGASSRIDKVVWEGTIKWFTKDGNLIQSLDYKNNSLHGTVITFNENQKLQAIYENGLLISGSANFDQKNPKQFLERKDSIIREVTYEKDLLGIRLEKIYVVNGYSIKEKEIQYYGNDGVYLGTSTRGKDIFGRRGTEVTYFKNPLRVKQIKILDDKGKQVIATYYPSGAVREQVKEGSIREISYLDPKGNILGTAGVNGYDFDGWMYSYGKQIRFYSDDNPEEMHLIEAIATYDREGNIIEANYFYKNQQLESKVIYENSLEKEIFYYNQNGKEIAKVVYKDQSPYQGTLIEDNTSTTYNQGNVVNKNTYYPDTKLVFRSFENEKAIYYDKNGNIIGEISYKSPKGVKEKNGVEHYLNDEGKIVRTLKYDKNINTFDKEYIYQYKNDSVSIKERYFDGEYKLKDIVYYSNTNQKRSALYYKEGEKLREEFYNRKGKKIGEYNYHTKTGTLYKYFLNSDKLMSIEEVQMGKIIKKKVFE